VLTSETLAFDAQGRYLFTADAYRNQSSLSYALALGRFLNALISYATDVALVAVANAVGYGVILVNTPAMESHHTLTAVRLKMVSHVRHYRIIWLAR
jgi:hypothetical protein